MTVALKGDPLTYNGLVLCGVFAAGVVLALGLFARRDLPTKQLTSRGRLASPGRLGRQDLLHGFRKPGEKTRVDHERNTCV